MPTGIYIRTEEYRRNMSKAMKGRIFTEEWKQKMRDNHKGMMGKHLSEEHKKKLSLIRMGNKWACKFGNTILTPEYRRRWYRKYYTNYLCEKPIDFGLDSIDHKIPISRGGTNEYFNLAIAHLSCNKKKHTKTDLEHKGGL